MIRTIYFLLIVILQIAGSETFGQSLTTFIFVRHAEKTDDGSKDPDLTSEGKQRAERLSEMLALQKVDAVYSTNYKRTRSTVEPVAASHQLSITSYASLDGTQLKELATRYSGGTVVICGHSNTTPKMINSLLGSDRIKQWEDPDYGNFVIVTVSSSGDASLTQLRY
jgi:2,3-bisphosphoglycerate-dependent phosphoglycerate mutase